VKGQVKFIKIKEENNHNMLNFIEIFTGGSKTDSGSKRGVQYKDISIWYLAFIIRNLCSNFINVKGEQFSIDSLIMSLLFEQDKIKKFIAIA